MATVRFTESIQRHVQCPTREIAGATLRDVLEAYFADNQRARGYVLDDQGALRKHMAIFVDGRQVRDRIALTDPVDQDAVVDLIQSLSGGTNIGHLTSEIENLKSESESRELRTKR